MEYRISWKNEAKLMLNKHIIFLSEVSINATIKLKILLKEKLIVLKYYPKVGIKINNNNNYRKLIINKRYSLIYYISQNSIIIEAVLDNRQNNKKYLY